MRRPAILAIYLLTMVGCAQVAQPVAHRRGDTPIEKQETENPIHGEVMVQYGTTGR